MASFCCRGSLPRWSLYAVACIAVAIADLVISLVLWEMAPRQTSDLLSTGMWDMAAMTTVRLVAFAVIGAAAVQAWQRARPTDDDDTDVSLRPLGAGLLDVEANGLSGASSRASVSDIFTLDDECLERQRERSERYKRGEKHRDACVWAIFVLGSVFALYVGLKCVSFHAHGGPSFEGGSILQGLIGCIVFCCHLEFYLIKGLILEVTKGDGIMLPWLHPHALYFVPIAHQRVCQVCRGKIEHRNHNASAFFCPQCVHHYYCINCVKRTLRQRTNSDRTAGEMITDMSVQEAVDSRAGFAQIYAIQFTKLIRPFWHWCVISIVLLGVNQVFQLALPHWQGQAFDAIVRHDSRNFLSIILTYFFVNACNGLFGSLQSFSVLMVVRKLMYRTRQMVFRRIIEQDISYFDQHLTGQIISRLTQDANQMTDPVNVIMNNLVSNMILLAGGMVMCFATSWKLSIMAMTSVLPATYVVRAYAEWAGNLFRKIMDNFSEMNGCATQAISNIRTVRIFGAEDMELDRFDGYLSKVYELDMLDSWVRILSQTLTSYLDLGLGVFVLWYGGEVIINGEEKGLTVGMLITFQLYWNMMKNAFNGLNNVLASLLRAMSASQRVLDLLNSEPTIHPLRGEEPPTDGEGTLRLEGVVFHYVEKRSERPVINNISLVMSAGETTALVGKSGSGKSTIVSLLLRLYDPLEGKVTLDGLDFKSLRPATLRSYFGVVTQETQLFAGSIEHNITYGRRGHCSQEDLEDAARSANALEFIQSFDENFASLVGDRGVKLSGGQRQRIAIARIFLKRPKILLLDEATSALDTENEALVQRAIDSLLTSGVCRTVVIVAHRLSTVRNADQIAVLEDGEIAEVGTHVKLLERKNGRYASLVARQLETQKERIDEDGVDLPAPKTTHHGPSWAQLNQAISRMPNWSCFQAGRTPHLTHTATSATCG